MIWNNSLLNWVFQISKYSKTGLQHLVKPYQKIEKTLCGGWAFPVASWTPAGWHRSLVGKSKGNESIWTISGIKADGYGKIPVNIGEGIKELVAGRIPTSNFYHLSSLITCPRETKEIPCPLWVPIITPSMMGGFTGWTDCQMTIKLAPDPPALSSSTMM